MNLVHRLEARWVSSALGLLLGSACVRYVPAPVDPEALLADWSTQDVRAAPEAAGHRGFDLDDGVSLREAEAVALFFNPSIRVTRIEAGIPAAEAEHAALWEDPELGVDGEVILADVDDPLVLGAGLSLTIPLSGQRQARKRLLEARSEAAYATVVGAEWALLQEVRRQWLELAVLSEQEHLLESAVRELQALSEATTALRAARALGPFDERILTLDLRRAQLDLRDVRALLSERELVVLRLLGLHPDHAWTLDPGDVVVSDDVVDEAPSVSDHPRVRAMLAAYAVAERRLELETRKQYPDLRIRLGGGIEEGQPRLGFGLGLIPLPVWNLNRAGIAAADAERSAVAARIEEILRSLVFEGYAARARALRATARVRALEEEIVPLARLQVEEARRLVSLGRLELFLLADAASRLRRARLDLADARASLARHSLTLSGLRGPSFVSSEVEP